jgi:hypothetical protein
VNIQPVTQTDEGNVMLRTNTDPTLEQQEHLDSEFKISIQEKNLYYATKQFENIRTVQNYVNNLLRLKHEYKYDLFHMTVTWKQTPLCDDPIIVQKDFARFYLRVLLPLLMGKQKIDRSTFAEQPICLASVESGSNQEKTV